VDCFFIVMAGWVFTVCLHEYGHAFVAWHGGDKSVAEKGYLTLNPLHYGHPLTSLILPMVYLAVGGIGLPGGAVYIDESRIRSKAWLAAVSLAGPAMNALAALLLLIPFKLHMFSEPDGVLAYSLAFLLALQISAILFNLLPIPSLDGFNFVRHWLPGPAREWLVQNGNIIFLVFIMVFLMDDMMADKFYEVVFWILDVMGAPLDLVSAGWRAFHFWR